MSPLINANKRKYKTLSWFYNVINNACGLMSGDVLSKAYGLCLFAFICGLRIVFDFESEKFAGVES